MFRKYSPVDIDKPDSDYFVQKGLRDRDYVYVLLDDKKYHLVDDDGNLVNHAVIEYVFQIQLYVG